jgi:hypothetical protein
MADELYYAKGLEVWKSPVGTKIEGGESVSVGFHACTASDVIGEEGAVAIAALLCLGEQAKITDAQVETALTTWFKGEISWDKGMAPWSADQFRTEMRATLEAALAAAPTPPPSSHVEADRLRRMVEHRDEFIISKGLWDQFKEASREAQ